MTEQSKQRVRSGTSAIFGFVLGIILLTTPSILAETLTIDQAIAYGLKQSPSVVKVLNSLKVSEELLNAEESSLKSQIRFEVTPVDYSKETQYSSRDAKYFTSENLSSSAGLNVTQRLKWTDATLRLANNFTWRESESDLTGQPKQSSYNNNLTLSLTQPLFTYNRTKHTLKSLELDYETARINYALQRLSIEQQVTRLYFDVFQRSESAKISQEEYDNTLESFEIIRKKVEAGISAQEELLQAEINLANSQASLNENRMSYENALDDLKSLLGLALDAEIDLFADVQIEPVAVDLAQAVDHGLNHRMELRQRDIDIENARLNLIQTGANNEFEASLDLRYGLTGTDEEFGNLYDNPDKSQGASLTLSIPIWDWGQQKSLITSSEIRLENRILDKTDEETNIEVAIRSLHRSLENQTLQIEIAEKNVQNAQLTYEINLDRYRNGDISSKEIGEYQTQLSREKLNLVSSLINYRLALLDMKIASLYDFENGTPVIEID